MLVKDKYPEVLETNTVYYPSDWALSNLMYHCHLYNRWNQMDSQRVIDMVITCVFLQHFVMLNALYKLKIKNVFKLNSLED